MVSVTVPMAVNPLPPQAFTKETLQKAYTWLLTQPTSIKEMASTQDMLISLYLKAQRNGEASLDTPSIQNFKQELKSLAGIMGDLQTPQPQSQPTVSVQVSSYAHNQNQTYAPQIANVNSAPSQQSHYQPPGFSLNQLDSGSIQALNDVKNTLNLASEADALRALIALGYRQFKRINT